ncbi:CD1871A family CXXC motif-containing protein [Treponema zioleckii]|uniref:CD1871A family CXXC motif-containing protein n=1 Tax=Treponema zioleckii TaxID=331680 RepID=UPI00168BE093|nr:CD1871A family CXXC motif-containing protein [Treponema zioleckii]
MRLTERKRKIIAAISLCLGILFVITGIFRGEAETVFYKATRICMECIGIG